MASSDRQHVGADYGNIGESEQNVSTLADLSNIKMVTVDTDKTKLSIAITSNLPTAEPDNIIVDSVDVRLTGMEAVDFKIR